MTKYLRLAICSLFYIVCFITIASPKKSNKIIITGIVENSSRQQNYVEIAINRLVFNQHVKKCKIDKFGRFKCEFNITQPTDLWFDYRTNFLIAVHPGDSIHVRLDGSQKNRPSLLNTINFSGTADKLNQDIALLQQKYFNSELYTNTSREKAKKENKTIKNSTPDEYTEHLYKLKDKVYNSFLRECKPGKEACIWADFFLTTSVLKKVSSYPSLHKKYNNIDKFTLPLDYYDILLDALPITDSMLICGASISQYTNNYHYHYALTEFNYETGYIIVPNNFNIDIKQTLEGRIILTDSIVINGLIENTQDSLLRQLVLTQYFLHKLEKGHVSMYENNINVIQEYIKRPFLLNPLDTYYNKVKKRVDNPTTASEQILRASSNSSISSIIDSILLKHKNKVIYIDCWATYCAPCLSEMPNSKILMNDMSDKNVGFVYLCLDSEKKRWKTLIDKHQLKGDHYLLTKTQSDDLRRIYEIDGIPHYIIIDKKGMVLGKEKYNLRPNEAQKVITRLLKN